MANNLCCGCGEVTTASMETVRGILTLVCCDRCGQRGWSYNGEPPTAASRILAAAQRKPTRHLVAVRSREHQAA